MTLSEQKEQLGSLLKAVRRSRKYRHIHEDLVVSIGSKELSKEKSLQDAVKATKSKLHQVCGAYFAGRPDYDRWTKELREALTIGEEAFRLKCQEIMGLHSSTRERLPFLDEFYSKIFSHLPPIHSIVDMACGFNPLAIPWMPVEEGARYQAYDVYYDLVEFLNEFMGISGVDGMAEARDITLRPPEDGADLALILYSIPCLDKIDGSASGRLLDSIDARHLVVSFPIRTLGGVRKGMREHYAKRFDQLMEGRSWETSNLNFDTELVYLIEK
jgi:16S rRNA (guanine(1405)-N(7))-methyltransferase